jgi:hypothetical protein
MPDPMFTNALPASALRCDPTLNSHVFASGAAPCQCGQQPAFHPPRPPDPIPRELHQARARIVELEAQVAELRSLQPGVGVICSCTTAAGGAYYSPPEHPCPVHGAGWHGVSSREDSADVSAG